MENTPKTAAKLTLGGAFETPSRDEWLKLVDSALKGGDFTKRLVSRTYDGLEIQPLTTRTERSTRKDFGNAHIIRGRHVEGHDLPGWDLRQRFSYADPAEANRAILEDLERGVTSIALVPPKNASLEWFERAFDTVVLDAAPLALESAQDGPGTARNLAALWSEWDLDPMALHGSLGLDPLGQLARTGAGAQDVNATVHHAATCAAELTAHAPHMAALTIDTRPYHLAGASEGQELAAMLATGAAYLRALDAEGIAADRAARMLCVTMTADTDQFLTIAKLRAARRLWDHLLSACGITDASRSMTLHVETAERMMTRRDPHVNILRTTIAGFGAAIGGADSISILPFTHALGQPDSAARRVARNIQIILMEESNLARVIDPAGGAWSIEQLTDDLTAKAWDLFQDIEREGGMARSLISGAFAARIAETHEKRLRNIATRKDPLTGVSEFPLAQEYPVSVAEAWPEEPSHPAPALPRNRLAAPYEALRDAAEAGSGAPRVCLVTLGSLAEFSPRADFARNLLAAGGVTGEDIGAQSNARSAVDAFKSSGADVAILCSSTDHYSTMGDETVNGLKAAGAKAIFVAGRPGEVTGPPDDQFLYMGCDVLAALVRIHAALGISAEGERS